MMRSLPAKRCVVGIATAFLLLCQTAMAMATGELAPPASAASAPAVDCHGVALQLGNGSGHDEGRDCPACPASASFAKLDVPQATDLPVLHVKPDWPRAPLRGGLLPVDPLTRAEPPPLAIVHCCLRN